MRGIVAQVAALLLVLVSAPAAWGQAFPSLGVLDAFTRSDGAIGGNWVTWPLADTPLEINSNAARASTASGFDGSLYNVAVGPDVEVYVTITELVSEGRIMELTWRQDTTTSTDTRYSLVLTRVAGSNNDTLDFGKAAAGSYTLSIGGTVALGFDAAVGDKVGVRMIGSNLSIQYKQAAGAWTEVATRSDSSITAAGLLGVLLQGQPGKIDDFGGGTMATCSGALLLLGIGGC